MTIRFATLLLAILLLILLAPFVGHGPAGGVVTPILGASMAIAGIWAVSDSRRHLILALVLGVPATAGSAMSLSGGTVMGWPGLAAAIAFYGYAAWLIGARVLGSKEVSSDTLAGSACVYLLLGLVWFLAYLLLEHLQPGSFAGLGSVGAGDPGRRLDMLYFSFVTLTTLGYGDITPATAQARALVVVEAVSGVLFVAILIARLVGLYGRRTT